MVKLQSGEERTNEQNRLRYAQKEYSTPKTPFKIFSEKSALLVIDMQNEFLDQKGVYWIPEATRQIEKLNKLIEVCRRMKVPVIYTKHMYHPHVEERGAMFRLYPFKRLIEGTEGSELYRGLTPPKSTEKVVRKHKYSAFFETELDTVLRNLKVEDLIITGTMTNYCSIATAFDALARDYNVIFVSDLNSTTDPVIHESILRTVRKGIGRVLSADELINVIQVGKET